MTALRSGSDSEGLNILRHANVGKNSLSADAETRPYATRSSINMTSIQAMSPRFGVVAVSVASWLLDLTAIALFGQPDLSEFSGRVSDSGEGRWTIIAAIDEGARAPVLSAALYQRFASRGEEDFGDKLLSAMRFEFGGHIEKKQ